MDPLENQATPEAPAPAPAEPAPKLNPTALAGGGMAEGPADGPADENENQAPDAARPDTAPGQPEGYKLNFAEGTVVDGEILGRFQKTAHELGLSLGQAQKVADLYAGHISGLGQKFQEAQVKALNDYIEARNAELARRPDFKSEVVLARKTLMEFGSQELQDVLQETAMGSHPALFDFMVKVGRALGEPAFRGGAPADSETPLHERVWGKDGMGPSAPERKN